ncbi:B12-binding domain-containing radical SAM protein [bacterium]|nr:B12-binding domain-containing radical SAM protein [candidate division CSSED10-310 bacterium]
MAYIVLINPRIGIYSTVFKPFIPLSLLAAAAPAAQAGHTIEIIDQAVDRHWETSLRDRLSTRNPAFIGITSMTGAQLKGALKAAAITREYPGIPVVFGGVHASLFPEGTLMHPHVDYVVVGEGETALMELLGFLTTGVPLPVDIPSLGWKDADGAATINPRGPFHNMNALPDTPYDLIDIHPYLHTYFWEKNVIDMETSRGCPYNCGFCYNEIYNQRTWRAMEPEKIVRTMESLVLRTGVTNFLFIDDSFFIDSKRVMRMVDMLEQQPFRVKMGFQGRINSVAKLSDSELERLLAVGAVFFQFGVESGSPRILKLINKCLDVDEVLAMNQRMRQYESVSTFYNFMVGLPTETRDDVMATVDLAWRLLEENPRAYLGTIHLYKEYPGTPLYRMALESGYTPPRTLEEWANYDWQSVVLRSHDQALSKLCRAVSAASYCVDRKIEMLGDSRIAGWISDLYRPIARFRFKHKFFRWMPEARIFG